MLLNINQPYLWLPVAKSAEEKKLHFYVGGEKVQEVDIRLGKTDCDFYACMDVQSYMGQKMNIEGASVELLQGVFCYGEKPQNVYPFRPRLHFSPDVGWHNDPNGMVYADGWYHLYYQWNPYGTTWGNMHWGHVRSRDLYHWEHRPTALFPNGTGTMYSGCAIADTENLLGYGKDALLFYYTAAGGRNDWSKEEGNRFTQRLAYSTDGGETLHHSDKFFMPFIVNENRDPKIFYHEPSKAYIMTLYLDENDFAIYRSENLTDWEETQRFTKSGMWECPDLFELEVKNAPGEKKWVFWSADGYYVVGEFDGYTFTGESKRQYAYSADLAYAAQTFSGTPGRVISMAWVRMINDRGNYRGVMSLPTELSLIKEGDDYRMSFAPARELEELKGAESFLEGDSFCPEGKAVQLVISAKGETRGSWELLIGKKAVRMDFSEGILSVVDTDTHQYSMRARFNASKPGEIRMIVDQEIIEFFAEDGKIYGMAEMEENILGMTWQMKKSRSLEATCRWCAFE